MAFRVEHLIFETCFYQNYTLSLNKTRFPELASAVPWGAGPVPWEPCPSSAGRGRPGTNPSEGKNQKSCGYKDSHVDKTEGGDLHSAFFLHLRLSLLKSRASFQP